ncbi:class I glutamine amidotransferase-like protein [Thozetella sp. PMI_491]|nr:class I glutamine amidotransferase-like protein [Thozetella sp. PMI_491]
MANPKVIIVLSDYGHEPTETAVPYTHFKNAGFDVAFATETGNPPACDKKMLEGITGKLLGAKKSVVDQYRTMVASEECQKPRSWTAPDFTLDDYELVMLPGGHDRAVRQVIESAPLHKLLASYVPQTKKGGRKVLGAVCHGPLVLASAKREDGKSLIHDFVTTALPGPFESGIYWTTRAFLGDYYKTYGHGSENVEDLIRKELADHKTQYKTSVGPAPFVVEDPQYNYVSGRFPGDVELLSQKMVELVKSLPAATE